MDPIEQKHKVNPLTSLMRQPKIYIKLPSGGNYWAPGSLNTPLNGEFPVYSMTARDELLLKTPDALMNGQAVVDVIQSCLPNINDAWQTPNIDLDVILIAIRLATYGDQMETSITIGEEEMTYGINLRVLLDNLMENIMWNERIEVSDKLVLYIKPVNYHIVSKTSIQNFETQKIMSLVNNSALSEDEKVATFKDSFKKLTDITVGIINDSVFRIDSIAGTTDDPAFIREFMENCDKEVYDAIKHRLDELKENNTLKPMRVKSTPEMIAQGAEEEIEIPITFDTASFFA